jgi:hypothetical protein
MTEASYRLIFEGKISPGQEKERVKKNLRSLLKITEKQVEDLFSGKPFVLKKQVNGETAHKAKTAFRKVGAILRAEKLKGEAETLLEPVKSPNKGSSVAVAEKGHSRDIPALMIFIIALCVFIGLCGYLAWRGFNIKDIEKQVAEAVSETVKEAAPLLKKWTGDSEVAKPRKSAKSSEEPVLNKRVESAAKKARGRHRTEQPGAAIATSDAGAPLFPENAARISVSISGEFEPVGMKLSSRSGVLPKLSDSPPGYLLQAPEPKGGQRKYGKLLLGTGDNRTYDFILDIIPDGRSLLYFDGNQNRNLTDDPPLENRGRGIFGTVIQIPMRRLIKEMNRDGDFKIWFFTNKSLWAKGGARHYSITQMKGRVTVHGKNYQAYIAERGGNEADFTNDGIFIDLNGNGKIETDTEYFPDGGIGNIDGKECRFDIRW